MLDPNHPTSFEFGRFTVNRHRREILAGSEPVALGERLFDLLLALMDARGTVVSKSDLMRQVWPGRVVEENNLTVAISALRRALGESAGAIRTISGRGYQFVSEVRERTAIPNSTEFVRTNLPAPASELIGREAALCEVRDLVLEHRLSTLTGAGGIGKTRLALEAARGLLASFPDGVWVVDLAPLTDGDLVATSVAIALGLSSSDTTSERLASALKGQRILVLLDNCEHLIDAAAHIASQLVRAAPNVFVMCTSREALRAEGEWLYQVHPLDVPQDGPVAEEAVLSSGAAKLFIARVRAAQPRFQLEPSIISRIASVCRRLDGMPLAIELAAARAASLGVQGVAARLNERFRLLTGGSRTALPRHQTLRATLDWSYELLSEDERLILCRLGVFASEFSLDSATGVLADYQEASGDIAAQIALLVDKSLVSAHLVGDVVRYRMLETTRAYALEKLAERGETRRYAERHARYHLAVFKRAWMEWTEHPVYNWALDYCRLIDDARVALDWAFSPDGDSMMGAELTVYLAALWIRLSLPSEWATRARQALDAIASSGQDCSRLEMQLSAALGIALMNSNGGPECDVACANALQIAERLHDTEYQLVALYSLSARQSGPLGSYRRVLAYNERFAEVARVHGDPSAQQMSDALMGYALLLCGDLERCARHVDPAASRHIPRPRHLPLVGFEHDSAGIHAYALWLRGFPDQCLRVMTRCAEETLALGHGLTLCYRFGQAVCPLFLLIGDLHKAEQYLALLVEQLVKTRFLLAEIWVAGLSAALQIARGDLDRGIPALRSARARRELATSFSDGQFTAIFAEALGRRGQVTEALSLIDEAIREAEVTDIHWFTAEHLRIKGDLLLLASAQQEAGEAERSYLRSLEIAHQQGALAWELRSATSLGRLRREQGESEQAILALQPVYDRFTEGFDTAELATARALLDDLRSASRTS